MRERFQLAFVGILIVLILVLIGFQVLNLRESRMLVELERVRTEPVAVPVIENSPEKVVDHAFAIDGIERDAGMRVSVLMDLIIRDEGKRVLPYLDTHGNPTIGVGRNLKGNGISITELYAISGEVDYNLLLQEAEIRNGRAYIRSMSLAQKVFVKPLTEHDVRLLLSDDLANTRHEAISVFGEKLWNSISEARRLAIVDVLFNLGLPRFKTFVKFIGHVKNKEWKQASVEILLSDAARDSIVRFSRASFVIRHDNVAGFDLK